MTSGDGKMKTIQPPSIKYRICFVLVIALSVIPATGFSFPSNGIYQKNSKFMYHPTLIEELYQKNSVTIATIDTLSRRELLTVTPRKGIETGSVPIQIFREPRFAIQEIYRIAEEKIVENNITSAEEKNKIRARIFAEKLGMVDKQAIEGVAIAIADSPASKIIQIFLKLENFKHYTPNVFLESIHLKKELLVKRGLPVPDNVHFQYSKIKISGAQFSQTLRYEMSSEANEVWLHAKNGKQNHTIETAVVAWEIDPLFKDDAEHKQEGVLMNNGSFIIQPYIDENGTVNPNRSIILYHIYIKLEPSSLLVEFLEDLFKDSIAKNVLLELASAMRREASR